MNKKPFEIVKSSKAECQNCGRVIPSGKYRLRYSNNYNGTVSYVSKSLCISCLFSLDLDKIRNCIICQYYHNSKNKIDCEKGGLTEIADPYKQLSKTNCNAWKLKVNRNKLMVLI